MNQRRMMTTLVKTFVFAFFAANLAGHALAEAQSGSPQAAFEKLKALAGKWQGTTDQEGQPATEVRCRVTAGNSAVFETLFPNTDHEMVTAYHLDSGRL